MSIRSVWVTRARPSANWTRQKLEWLGLESVVAPLLEMAQLPYDPAVADGVAALAFTSVNGVETWVRRGGRSDLPMFAVGPATAEALRQFGPEHVRLDALKVGHGGVTELAELIIASRPDGEVLHVGAAELAGDLAGTLRAAGVPARSVAVYETTETGLPVAPETDAVLVMSPRAARALARLSPGDGRLAACLSEAVAAPLRSAGFTRVAVADCPNEDALLRLLRP